ncbi:MAG TPA: ABC transporter permease [Streptosporangiaceae bacterium]|nr:ABC transporter permease [Streptosporangiaceae bacterium]
MRGRHAAPPRWQLRLPQPVTLRSASRNGHPGHAAQARPSRARSFRIKPTEAAGAAILGAMIVFCFIAPLFYRPDLSHVDLTLASRPPGGGHLLGTDPDGIDVLGRLMTGGQLSLELGVAAGILATVIGSLWGATAGYLGGAVDAVMMRVVDAGFAIPAVVLLLLVSSAYTPSPALLILVIAATSWLGTARLVRGAALTLRTREFVQAVKTMGGGRTRAIVRHVVPNALGLITVNVSFQIADAIVVLATLSYLGLGVQPPSSDWGDMIAAGVPLIYSGYWWEIYPAGIAIILVVIALNLLGDALSDRLDAARRRH